MVSQNRFATVPPHIEGVRNPRGIAPASGRRQVFRMAVRNPRGIALTALLAALLLAGCGPSVPAPAATTGPPASTVATTTATTAAPAPATQVSGPPRGGTLRVNYGAEVDNLNAFTSQFLTDIELTMVEGLIVSNDKNEYIPVLARQIPTVANGGIKTRPDGKLDMTWPLQQGVKWSDGQDLTSDDVCFTWKFIIGEGSQVYNRDSYLPISDCQTPDKHTVVMTWDKASALYNTLFEAVLPKHMLEGKNVVTYDGYNRSPLGTGPFVFVEWKAGQYVRVKRNPSYWRGPQYPYLDEIVFNFVPDTNTRLNALKAGETDYTQLATTQVKDVKGLPNYTTIIVPQNSWQHFDMSIGTDRGKKLFSDLKLRQALFYAIDRQSIANGALEGTVTVADTVTQLNSPYFDPNVMKYPYDPAKAKQLLDDAGWKVGADGIREKDGEKLSLTGLLTSTDSILKLVMQIIQQNFKSVGVDLKFDPQESAARSKIWRSGQWEVTVSRWVTGANPSITGLYACKGANNMTSLCDPELDKVMLAADVELDAAKRKPLLDQAQELLAKDAFSLPIYYGVNPIVMSNKLGNFKASGTNLGPFWNVYEWYLSK